MKYDSSPNQVDASAEVGFTVDQKITADLNLNRNQDFSDARKSLWNYYDYATEFVLKNYNFVDLCSLARTIGYFLIKNTCGDLQFLFF